MAYNGWKNYETWNVALWYGNDQCSERETSQMAQDAYDNATADRNFTRMERATLDLAEALQSMVEDSNPLSNDASMWSDLLSAALSEVDWHEWAENLLSDVEEEKEEEEEEETEDIETN